MPNLVAVRRSCRKGWWGTDIHTDKQTDKGTAAALYVTHLYKTSHMSQITYTEFFICAERGEDGL